MLMLTEVHGMLSLSSVCAHQSFQEVNHQLESRMRENRQSGSEGGGTKPIASPYPYEKTLAQKSLDLTTLQTWARVLVNELKFQSSSRHDHRCSADTNLFDAAGLAL